MDTEYTKGFRAGMAWREAEIIKLLDEGRAEGNWCQRTEHCNHSLTCHEVWDWLENAIALFKGEK